MQYGHHFLIMEGNRIMLQEKKPKSVSCLQLEMAHSILLHPQ